jgi:hypothetical protein
MQWPSITLLYQQRIRRQLTGNGFWEVADNPTSIVGNPEVGLPICSGRNTAFPEKWTAGDKLRLSGVLV